MEISTECCSTSLSLSGQQSFEAAVPPSARLAQPLAPKDTVAVSDEALDSSQKLGHPEQNPGTMPELLKAVLGLIAGRDVTQVQTPAEGEAVAASPPAVAAGYREATLSTESISLSLSGTIATRDGKQLGFSLSLQYDQASLASQAAQVQPGTDGLSLNFAGTSVELSSTSFSFTLSAAGDGGPTGGRGSFHLNGELGKIEKQMKPLLKEFMKAAGLRGGWGDMNRRWRSMG